MKIIQSLWTKPFFSDQKRLEKTRVYYNLSAKYLCQMGVELELYTDAIGAELFGSEHFYNKIHNILNQIDHFDTRLWSVAKIYALLRAQSDEIVHIDGDIFIRKPDFFKKILADHWDLLVQSQEVSDFYYDFYDKSLDVFREICNRNGAQEEIFHRNLLKHYNYTYNVGVMGFRKYEVLKNFAQTYFKMANFLDSSRVAIDQYNASKDHRYWTRTVKVDINCIIEQVQFHFFSKYYNLHVKEVLPLYSWPDIGWQFFQHVNLDFGYEHLAGLFKYDESLNADAFFEKAKKELYDGSLINKYLNYNPKIER